LFRGLRIGRHAAHLEADDVTLLAAEFDTDQMDRLAAGLVSVRIAVSLELREGATSRLQLDDLELEQVDLPVEAQREIQPSGIARLLGREIEPE
jgi:hypothetical protein